MSWSKHKLQQEFFKLQAQKTDLDHKLEKVNAFLDALKEVQAGKVYTRIDS
jgi:hypothetical protein